MFDLKATYILKYLGLNSMFLKKHLTFMKLDKNPCFLVGRQSGLGNKCN